MIQTTKLEIPPSAVEFLHKMHDQHPVVEAKQSMRNGTAGYIPMNTLSKPIKKLMNVMKKGISQMLFTNAWVYSGLWSTRLPKGGFHVKHNHPKGWMSGVCYVDVPSVDSGHLEIEDRILIPNSGDLVLFPSETIHGVTVYEGPLPRLTVAFDLLPLVVTDQRKPKEELRHAA